MLGDTVKKAEIADNVVTKVYSYNHGDIPFVGKNIVLATGSYFSQGLIASQNEVYEPVFRLDVDYSTNRQDWYNRNMFDVTIEGKLKGNFSLHIQPRYLFNSNKYVKSTIKEETIQNISQFLNNNSKKGNYLKFKCNGDPL